MFVISQKILILAFKFLELVLSHQLILYPKFDEDWYFVGEVIKKCIFQESFTNVTVKKCLNIFGLVCSWVVTVQRDIVPFIDCTFPILLKKFLCDINIIKRTHHQNIQSVAIEMYKVHYGLSKSSFYDIFHSRDNSMWSWYSLSKHRNIW